MYGLIFMYLFDDYIYNYRYIIHTYLYIYIFIYFYCNSILYIISIILNKHRFLSKQSPSEYM